MAHGSMVRVTVYQQAKMFLVHKLVPLPFKTTPDFLVLVTDKQDTWGHRQLPQPAPPWPRWCCWMAVPGRDLLGTAPWEVMGDA